MVRQSKNRHHPRLRYEFLNRYSQRDENNDFIHSGFEVLNAVRKVKNSDLPDLGCEFLKRHGHTGE
jgi:hypothetical protein